MIRILHTCPGAKYARASQLDTEPPCVLLLLSRALTLTFDSTPRQVSVRRVALPSCPAVAPVTWARAFVMCSCPPVVPLRIPLTRGIIAPRLFCWSRSVPSAQMPPLLMPSGSAAVPQLDHSSSSLFLCRNPLSHPRLLLTTTRGSPHDAVLPVTVGICRDRVGLHPPAQLLPVRPVAPCDPVDLPVCSHSMSCAPAAPCSLGRHPCLANPPPQARHSRLTP